MEKNVVNRLKKMPLKKSLFVIITLCIILILILSSLTVVSITKAQRKLIEKRAISITLENSEKIVDGEITYEIERNRELPTFTFKQGIVYYGSMVLMIVIPILYGIVCIAFSAKIYYRLKLREPLLSLKSGIGNITDGNLDFQMNYENVDELGELCNAMEIMRKELRNDKKKIANLIEDKKALNASMSHDLGTPITVIKGYIQYLKKGVSQDMITEDILLEILDYMSESTERLEGYVQCVRNIQKLDDIELNLKYLSLEDVFSEMANNLKIIGNDYDITIKLLCDIEYKTEIYLDKQAFFRVLENILKNALRYAKKEISITFALKNQLLQVCVMDDGTGFSKKTLGSSDSILFVTDDEENHFGIGLSICRILCKKHGGYFEISNNENGGGRVYFSFEIDNK